MRKLIDLIAESTVSIEGLPSDVEISDQQLLRYAQSPRYRLRAVEDGKGDYVVIIEPRHADLSTFENPASRGRIATVHYDAGKAKLIPYDPDPDYAMGRQKPELDPGFVREIEPLDGEVMYRGISVEEWQHINRTRVIQSNGTGNLGTEQQGLTYWSTEVGAAQRYADAFAMQDHKAAPGFPAYVIAAPLATNTRHVDGVAGHEVGVVGPVALDDLLAVWEGKVWHYEASDTLLRQHWDATWRSTGVSAPRTQLEWRKIL